MSCEHFFNIDFDQEKNLLNLIFKNELSPLQDDALANTKSMGIQYKELEEEKGRVERRLEQLQKSLGDVEEGM